ATITSEELLLVSALTRRAASVIDRRGRSRVPGLVSAPEAALTKSCWAADGPAVLAINSNRGKIKGVRFSASCFTIALYPSSWQLSRDLFRGGWAMMRSGLVTFLVPRYSAHDDCNDGYCTGVTFTNMSGLRFRVSLVIFETRPFT